MEAAALPIHEARHGAHKGQGQDKAQERVPSRLGGNAGPPALQIAALGEPEIDPGAVKNDLIGNRPPDHLARQDISNAGLRPAGAAEGSKPLVHLDLR